MTQVGSIYGDALYQLAVSENLDRDIGNELNTLCQSFQQEPGFIRLLGNPALTKQERCQIIDDAFRGKLHPYVLNFLKILTEKGYMRYFSDCCTEFTQQYQKANNILAVNAVSAVSMTSEQKQSLSEKLAGITGKTILLNNQVDPACLGGVRLDYDGQRLDGTVKSRLNTIQNLLKNTVL